MTKILPLSGYSRVHEKLLWLDGRKEKILAVAAKPGLGKSMIARGLVKSLDGATLYQCHFGLSPYSLTKSILALQGIKCRSLVAGLADLARLCTAGDIKYLIIDEADLLPIGAIEALRWLQDVCPNLRLILFGEQKLTALLKSEERIKDRVTFCPLPRPSRLDARMLANNIAEGFFAEDLISWVFSREGTNLRRLTAAFLHIRENCSGEKATCEVWQAKPLSLTEVA